MQIKIHYRKNKRTVDEKERGNNIREMLKTEFITHRYLHLKSTHNTP